MINVYINDIFNSLKNKCYFSALALALALPDMCGAAEYPEETSVTKRYIDWIDKYLGYYMKTDAPVTDLNGELLYNLRNQFLHSGSTNIDTSKVKNESNVLDRFILVLGDGTAIWSASSFIESSLVTFRAMTIDVTYLCETICDFASWYYNNNKNRFKFSIPAVTQERFMNPDPKIFEKDPIVNALNKKLKENGSDWEIKENPERNTVNEMSEAINFIFSDESLKQRFLDGEPISVYKTIPDNCEVPNYNTRSLKDSQISNSKREAQVRSFFGRNFKEYKYKQHKEQIIQAVLQSECKLQVNNRLMKVFSSEETSIVYKRLAPLIKDMPGKI